ncbi:uncharacterized protein GGS22DRAFT_159449 [Annulohypoxylon maeteangense]|uniref:uncharacterized protein n=1 Tax=Annulohypoxylon maeteangense TaxID=1927788 RepID=UPI0020079EE1|nr:uncharacterized protein GGS22DRAFT_159449 [Annulohypoxylon maeteangense]KAI0885953.1 hypothetical protein GGS22DRAFT_159449 [Annulohypoxylon maeteangense]
MYFLSFGMYLYFPSSKPSLKYCIVATYVAFFLISVAPVILESTLESDGTYGYRQLLSAVFFGIHTIYINPIITALAVIAVFPQRHEILSRREPGALSVMGLLVQAVVFAVVACVWPVRFTIGSEVRVPISAWYQLVGWAAVDNLIFAIVQAVLFWTSRKFRVGDTAEEIAPEETTPLMAERV